MKLLARAWPHNLVGRLIVVSAGFFVLVCLIGWWALASAIRAPAAEAVDNRMITLGQELRGYWATATIVGQSPQGPADLEWHWQIQVEDGPVYSSEQLSSEDILLPVGADAATDAFGFQQIESDLGTLWMVQRRIAEIPPAPPGLDTPAPHPVMVTYSVALTTGYRHELIGEQIAPLQRAGRNVLAVFAGLTALLLISLGLLVQRPLGRLTQAARRFQSGDSARLDGAYPSEIDAVVSSLNDVIGQNDRLVERTRRYIGKIAHDLKHPLAIVRNALDNPEDHEIAKRRLDGMVGTLNRYSSLASAIGPGGPHAPFRLRQVLEDARDGFALLYRKTPLTIEVDCLPDLAVRMARQDLEALITNLVANAHQHAGSLVRLSAFQQGQGAMIVVEDDGPGLDEADCERALSWGVRLDTAPPGSGFGLAIVQDLAQLYAGEVSLDRSELNGLRAKIYLPEVQAFTIA